MTLAELPRAQAGAEPQRLLTTLLGDYWYWRDETIPSSTLVRLLGEFGITNDGARAAMRRLHNRGLLVVSRNGRSTSYGIPERTSEVIVTRTNRMLSFGASPPGWDGRWTIVAFSVPEGSRDVRAALRSGLRLRHFGVLYDGLWVSPHDRTDDVLALLRHLEVDSGTVLRATEPDTGSNPNGLIRAFDLRELEQAYRAFADRYEPLVERVHAGDIGPAEALVLRTTLRVDWRNFPEIDPDLPAELLPLDWPRPRARRCFLEIYDLLGPLAELRFRQIIGATDPDLAELTSHFTSASVAELQAQMGTRTASGDTPFERAAAARLLDAQRNGTAVRRR